MALYKFKVNKVSDNKTVQNFLSLKLKNKLQISSRNIKNIINKKGIIINGRMERMSAKKVLTGDIVSIKIDKDDLLNNKKLIINKDSLIFLNDDYLALNKVDGYPSTPVDRKIPSLLEELRKYMQDFANPSVYPLHRLDIDTSGVIIFARNRKAEKYLLEQFRLRNIEKSYLAFIKGRIDPEEGIIDDPLALKNKGKGFEVWQTKNRGKAAVTEYRTVFTTKNYSFLKLIPKTGRPHQIRVHLSAKGFPIIGDNLYGSSLTDNLVKRTMLHAYSLSFKSASGEKITIKADVPGDFRALLKKFGMPLSLDAISGLEV